MHDSSNPTIESILQRCAELRGISPLMNRTYEEFNWFTMSVLFGKIPELGYSQEIYNEYNGMALDYEGNIPYGLAIAFLDYCEKRYDPKQHQIYPWLCQCHHW